MPSLQKNSLPEKDIQTALLQTAFRFLGYRDRFRKEIELRLKRQITNKKFPPESSKLIPSILAKLEKDNLINDQELIDTYIKTQHQTKLRGPFLIRRKLLNMGASKDQVDESINRLITRTSQDQIIAKLIKKHKPDTTDNLSIIKFQRLLVSRGFNLDQIRQKIAFICGNR